MSIIDKRLQRACDELAVSRACGDETLITFWYAERERLLEEKFDQMKARANA